LEKVEDGPAETVVSQPQAQRKAIPWLWVVAALLAAGLLLKYAMSPDRLGTPDPAPSPSAAPEDFPFPLQSKSPQFCTDFDRLSLPIKV
jgi:hypothetical protein